MTRQEIIDLIHNEYDQAPSDYRLEDNWDDGSGRIADVVIARIEALEAALQEIIGHSAYVPPRLVKIARAALAPEQEPDHAG